MYSFIAVDPDVRLRLENAVGGLLLRPEAVDTMGQVRTTTVPLETMKRVRSIAVRIVSHLLQRLDVNAIVGTGRVRGFDEKRPAHTPDIHTLMISVDDNYHPSRHERVAFFGHYEESTRLTLEELRTRAAFTHSPPVCPDCGGIMRKEDDVDPDGIMFVSWRCDCLWTPTEEG